MVGDLRFFVQENLRLKLPEEVTLRGVGQEQDTRVGETLGVLVCCHIVLEVLQLTKEKIIVGKISYMK